MLLSKRFSLLEFINGAWYVNFTSKRRSIVENRYVKLFKENDNRVFMLVEIL